MSASLVLWVVGGRVADIRLCSYRFVCDVLRRAKHGHGSGDDDAGSGCPDCCANETSGDSDVDGVGGRGGCAGRGVVACRAGGGDVVVGAHVGLWWKRNERVFGSAVERLLV